MNLPSVSVVIPTYNYGRFLPTAIESVLAQTVAPLEIVVADDGSTDNTPDVAASYGDKITYRRFDHQGVFSIRQAILACLRGNWFLNLDADDWIEPNFVECALRAVAQNAGDKRLAFIYADRVDFGAYQRVQTAPEFDRELFKRGNFVPMNSLIRLEVARLFGFDPAFNDGWGDYDFFLTLAKNGYLGKRIGNSRIHCRVHADSITAATTLHDRKQQLMRRIVAKHSDFFDASAAATAIRRFAPAAVLRHRIQEAFWARRYGKALGLLCRTAFTGPSALIPAWPETRKQKGT